MIITAWLYSENILGVIMMKAVKAILMSLSLLLTFTSCVGNSSERTEDNDQNQTAASTEKQENPDRKSDSVRSG